MPKILLIASGENIAKYGRQLREELGNPEDFEVVDIHMEDAVRYVRSRLRDEVDVLIARGNTASLLREARLPYPVVTMPVTDFEIISAIRQAQEISGKESPLIGYIGLEDIISNVLYFLENLNLTVRLYKARSSADIQKSIVQAQKDGVDVLIGGIYTSRLLDNIRVKHVLLESSLASVREAYDRAKEVQRNVGIQKKKLEEKNTILDAVSDGIVSINENGAVSSANRRAQKILGEGGRVAGRPYTEVFSLAEAEIIRAALEQGARRDSQVLQREGERYLLSASPILVGGNNKGAIVSIQGVSSLRQAESRVRRELYGEGITEARFAAVTGNSPARRQAVSTGRRYAGLDANVLVIGAPGTGKHFFAQCIHNESGRRDGPFVSLNCPGLEEGRVNAALLGHGSGAERVPGVLELAHGGTLYLREVGGLPPRGQALLLSILEAGYVQPPASHEKIPIHVRVISTTSEHLWAASRDGRFLPDLYCLLNVLPLPLPGISGYREDIPLLVKAYLERFGRGAGNPATLSPGALEELRQADWDCNLTQLESVCRRIAALAGGEELSPEAVRRLLREEDSFRHLEEGPPPPAPITGEGVVMGGRRVSRQELWELEHYYGGNRSLMAKSLGISRTTLWKHLKRLGENGNNREK